MAVSRGTVQRLVTSGRHKLITALVDCRALLIDPPAEPQRSGDRDDLETIKGR